MSGGAARPTVAEPAPGDCGALGSLPLAAEPADLLDGRLTMRVLAGATNPESAAGVMTASEPQRGQSRIHAQRGGDALQVVATELFRRPGSDLVASVRRWLGPADDRLVIAELPLPSGLRGVTVAPRDPPARDVAVPALRVLVARPDDTVQHLGFFVSERAAADASGCAALLTRLVETIRPGPRELMGPGTRELAAGLVIDVPPDHDLLFQRGPDFEVFRLYRLAVLGGPHAELGIYVGAHPSSHALQAEVRESSGALLGRSVPWLAWSTSPGPGLPVLHHAEAIEPLDEEAGSWVHVFAASEDRIILGELLDVAGSIRERGEP